MLNFKGNNRSELKSLTITSSKGRRGKKGGGVLGGGLWGWGFVGFFVVWGGLGGVGSHFLFSRLFRKRLWGGTSG